MPKKFIVLLIVFVVLLVALVVVLTMDLRGAKTSSKSPYSAVYMASGDIYFGKLSWFPWPKLTNVWYLQRAVDENNQPQLSVAPFPGVFWGPMDEMTLNPRQVIFWTSLRTDSQLAQALANPSALTPPSAAAPSAESSQ
ncbi:hypothetical protein C4571_00245 [Candidatus Parcubacteria bacterium]|nr:MAG: hypothetical protein C4571_00245 [Candidatus Parcubacteria bacterium]